MMMRMNMMVGMQVMMGMQGMVGDEDDEEDADNGDDAGDDGDAGDGEDEDDDEDADDGEDQSLVALGEEHTRGACANSPYPWPSSFQNWAGAPQGASLLAGCGCGESRAGRCFPAPVSGNAALSSPGSPDHRVNRG